LVALREQDRSAEPAEAIQLDCGAVRIAGLSEEGLGIADERCPDGVRELRPSSGPEGDLFDEQLGGVGVPAVLEQFDDGAHAGLKAVQQGLHGGVTDQNEKHWWLVAGEATDQLGTLGGQTQTDGSAEGVADHVGRGQTQVLDQRGQVGYVVVDAAFFGRGTALAMASPVVAHDPMGAGQPSGDEVPAGVLNP
jgi:hypothetical protein